MSSLHSYSRFPFCSALLSRRHFKCDVCQKKMTTGRSLRTHSLNVSRGGSRLSRTGSVSQRFLPQVHKLDIKTIPAAKPGRDGLEPEVVGMTGVPEYVLQAKIEGRDLDEAIKEYKKMGGGPGGYGGPPPYRMPPPGPPGRPMPGICARGWARSIPLPPPSQGTVPAPAASTHPAHPLADPRAPMEVRTRAAVDSCCPSGTQSHLPPTGPPPGGPFGGPPPGAPPYGGPPGPAAPAPRRTTYSSAPVPAAQAPGQHTYSSAPVPAAGPQYSAAPSGNPGHPAPLFPIQPQVAPHSSQQ